MQIIPPHKNIAREVWVQDLEFIESIRREMQAFCFKPHGKHVNGGYAVAHPQITEDALRFFVTRDGVAYLNPKIIRHTAQIVKRSEGCLSYPEIGLVDVGRWNKIEVEFQLNDGMGGFTTKREALSGLGAQIFQHEINHCEGIFIIDKIV